MTDEILSVQVYSPVENYHDIQVVVDHLCVKSVVEGRQQTG